MIEKFKNYKPLLADGSFVHEKACVIGQVNIGSGSSIWPCVVLRGDDGEISIGNDTSIQDGSICHTAGGLSRIIIGNRVTVGHNVVLHGCTIEDECLIVMGSIILDNAVIKKGTIIGAGSLVTANKVYPERSLIMGSPAKLIRETTKDELGKIDHGWRVYQKLTKEYLNK